jgi:hypothetical protein
MLFFANAVACAFVAAIWQKSEFLNILIALAFAVMTVINAAGAARWLGF